VSFDHDAWEIVVGLEVHTELLTRTKLFSSAINEFGGEPNTHIDPLTLGLPGSLPVLNEQAVELAVRVGLALSCTVQRSVFARKNYFYPDLPKDYQISQFDLPICAEGSLELPNGKVVGIERAHLEEDTGKSTHVGGGGRIHDAQHSLVDYNRAGVPLLEIVGKPDLRSAEDARAYVAELRSVLVAVGASDGKLEEGSMRVDCNVSVRRRGDTELGTRCEIKNVNSLPPGRPDRGGGAGPSADPPLERGRRPHPHPALQGGGGRLPLLPRARPGRGGPRSRVDRAGPRRAAHAPGGPAAPAVAGDGRAARARGPGGRARAGRPVPGGRRRGR